MALLVDINKLVERYRGEIELSSVADPRVYLVDIVNDLQKALDDNNDHLINKKNREKAAAQRAGNRV